MAWYNNIFGGKKDEDLEEKLNPIQPYYDKTSERSREFTFNYERAYEELEIVNRGVNLIVDDCAEIDTIVQPLGSYPGIVKGTKASKVSILLNREPNPFQDISSFRRNLFTDYILDGNIFIYFDGAHV